MKTKTIFLSIFIASLTFLSGCNALMKDANAGGKNMAAKQVVAKVLIYDDNTYDLVSATDDKPGKQCRIKTNPGKGANPRCKGISNGNVEQILSIPLMRTKGSICWITYNSAGYAQSVCWP